VTDVSTAPTFPPGRYGRRRAPGRRRSKVLSLIGLLIFVAAAAAVSVQLYRVYGQNPQATVERVSDIGPSSVTVRIRVQKPDGKPATCRLQALDYGHAEVGYAQLSVPSGRDVTMSYTLATTAKPVAVTVLGCRTH
jgi:hypothetical protein